ncbi:GD15937 [Drosophila simulans]|uniref:GD15937 n=1 Tax=Drosophila simulans TaxID=7240 RepID=B4NW12_DROSI|nr:GD15937 [Drosophila simulans]
MVPQLWRDLSPDAAVAATATAMGSAAYAWLSQSQYRSFRRCDAVPAVCVYRDRLECLARAAGLGAAMLSQSAGGNSLEMQQQRRMQSPE